MRTELYIRRASIIHALDFRTKFFCLLLLFPLCGFLLPTHLLWIIVVAFTILAFLSRIGFGHLWRATKLYTIILVIGITGLGLVFYEGVLLQRLIEGLLTSLRLVILIWFGVLFAMITNPIEIPAGLMKMKVPHKYGITFMVSLRMWPLISKKIRNVFDAQRSRGAQVELSLKGLPKLPFLWMSFLVPVLHSTLETSVKLADTLLSRGYNPNGKITIAPSRLKLADYGLFLLSILIVVIAILDIF